MVRGNLIQGTGVLFLFALLLSACSEQGAKSPAARDKAAPKDTVITTTKTRTILFFGNSLTAGYGLEPAQAFPALIQQKIDSLGLPYKAVNAGVSGETSSGGNNRVDWILKQPVDVFVL